MGAMNPSRPAWPALAIVALLVVACSSPPTWEKAGANETAVANDTNDCRVQARFAPLPERYVPSPDPSTTTKVIALEDRRAAFETEVFQKCMTGKGYTAKR